MTEAQRVWIQSDRGKAARRKAQKTYASSEKGKANIAARLALDEVRKVNNARVRARKATPHGKAVREAYEASPEGRASNVERSHRSRARKRKATVEKLTPAAVMGVYKAFGGLCGYCQDQPAEELDHFIALSRGGVHAIKNLVACCARCNQRKYNKDPFSFLHDLKRGR